MSDIDMTTAIATQGYNVASGLLSGMLTSIDRIRQRNLSQKNLLRAYYFEVVNNIELLSIIKKERFKSEKPNSPLLRGLLQRIDTQVGATILFSEESDTDQTIFTFLEKKGKIANKNKQLIRMHDGKDTSVATKTFYENVLQAISFTVVKTEILKQLSTFTDSELEMLNKILLEKRITNILERFRMIKEQLGGIDDVSVVHR